jgi:hypothetical protein
VRDAQQGNPLDPKTVIDRYHLPAQEVIVTPGISNNWSEWNSIFVDRSIGASDWTLIISRDGTVGNENFFKYDGNIADDKAPILEDIVIEIEYRARNVVNAIWPGL